MRDFKYLVSADWLLQHLNDDNLIVLDASMEKPLLGKSNTVGEQAIPGAKRFDFEKVICDQESALPNTMPKAECFEREVRKLGVNNDSTIVVYDNMGVYSSPRAWWMFKVMGHDNIYVLNGGLPAWVAAGGSVSSISEHSHDGTFESQHQPEKLVSVEAVLSNLQQPHSIILDARSAARFSGEDADPRPHVKSGHIPGSKSMPYTSLQSDGHMLPVSELHDRFLALELTPNDSIIFSCGSGVTACILALAATEAGFTELAVYDGSWSEWGTGDYPVETGAD